MLTGRRSSNVTKHETLSATPKEIRKFGLMFGGICAAVAGFMLYKENGHWPWFGGGCIFFFAAGLGGHSVLRPIYTGWMKFAFVLGWINTRILLGMFFYLILTPTGLLMRVFGSDLLDEKMEPEVTSYWKKRTTPVDPKSMERQF